MSSTKDKDNKVSHGPIGLDEMDNICRGLSYADFSVYLANVSYIELCQIREELMMREDRISSQLNNRLSGGQEWRIKATTAKDILTNKLKIAQDRLDRMRMNNLSTLMVKYGGIQNAGGNRMACIRMLISILDRCCRTSDFTTEELSIIDLCRNLSGISSDSKFGTLSYNPVRSSVMLSDGTEVASINKGVFMAEEYGFRFAAADEMRSMIAECELMNTYFVQKVSCSEVSHDPAKCANCRIQALQKRIADMLARV